MTELCIISTTPASIKTFFGKQLSFLQDNGFEITVITSPGGSGYDFGELSDDIKLKTVKMSRTIKPLEDFKAFIKILMIIKQNEFGIVQYTTPKAALLGSVASWWAKVPVRLYLMWGLYYVKLSGIKKFIFKSIEKIICKLSTAIAPDSKGNLELAIKEGLCKAGKIGVVGHGSANGVDTERFDPARLSDEGKRIREELQISNESKLFGTIAEFVGDKGINELIEAFDIVSKSNPEVYLLYIGQTIGKDPVKESTLEAIKNNPKIIHLGWQTEPEKYLAAMDIFILPTYREGFGVVNIEASAMGLPVISTDVPGPQESILNDETGLLVPAKKVEPLAEAMKDLLDRPILVKRMGEAGRQRVLEFYEQKQLWAEIIMHRQKLLKESGIL